MFTDDKASVGFIEIIAVCNYNPPDKLFCMKGNVSYSVELLFTPSSDERNYSNAADTGINSDCPLSSFSGLKSGKASEIIVCLFPPSFPDGNGSSEFCVCFISSMKMENVCQRWWIHRIPFAFAAFVLPP